MVLSHFASEKRDNAYILASETCALDTIGAEYVRDVLPGETVTITPREWNCFGYVPRTAKGAGSEDAFSSTYILQDRTAISTA